MPQKIQIRRDTAANWTTANPILSAGELGYDTTAGTLRAGDGVTAWASLPAFNPGALLTTADVQELARDAVGSALVAGTNVTITPNDGADTITIAAAGGLASSMIDAKGDLIVGTSPDTPGRLPASGTQGAVLVTDSSTETGLNWSADPFAVTCPGATPTLLGVSANFAYAMRVFGSGLISKVSVQIGTSSGNICVGVYSNTGAGHLATPNARLATSGSVACPAGGAYGDVAFTAPVQVRTGDWLVVAWDNATATTFGVVAPGSGIANNGLARSMSAAFPLPTTFVALSSHDKQVRLWGMP
jgi:hypothetical protein